MIILMDLPFYFQIEKEAFYETFTIKIRKYVCVEFQSRRTSMRRYEQRGAEQDQVLLGTENPKHWISL